MTEKDKARQPLPEPREVRLVHNDYQPSKAELEADLRVEATFEEASDALVRPVRIRNVIRPGSAR